MPPLVLDVPGGNGIVGLNSGDSHSSKVVNLLFKCSKPSGIMHFMFPFALMQLSRVVLLGSSGHTPSLKQSALVLYFGLSHLAYSNGLKSVPVSNVLKGIHWHGEPPNPKAPPQLVTLSNNVHPTPLHTPGKTQALSVNILSSEHTPLMYGAPATNFTRAEGNKGSS